MHSEPKRKLVIGIVAIACIALIVIVGASLIKKVAVGPDRQTAPVSVPK